MNTFDETKLREEYTQIEKRFTEINVYQSPDYPKLAKRHKELSSLISLLDKKVALHKSLKQAQELMSDDDSNLINLAKTEIEELNDELQTIDQRIEDQLKPQQDSTKYRDCILEIRAGVGGSEAALFAGDLYRMYIRWAEKQNWQIELINQNMPDTGGFKEIIVEICGENAYKLLQFESGVHRVQRIPTTESQGRIHTSTASVAVLPKIEEAELEIPAKDIKIDTYKSSGPGGQSVNKTDSAVRITHLPTNLIVTCQDGKSQSKNKERALSILRARLIQRQEEEQEEKASLTRKKLIGKATRTEKIRTYNFPQNRITDHRINLSVNNLIQVLNGDLQILIDEIQAYDTQSTD